MRRSKGAPWILRNRLMPSSSSSITTITTTTTTVPLRAAPGQHEEAGNPRAASCPSLASRPGSAPAVRVRVCDGQRTRKQSELRTEYGFRSRCKSSPLSKISTLSKRKKKSSPLVKTDKDSSPLPKIDNRWLASVEIREQNSAHVRKIAKVATSKVASQK